MRGKAETLETTLRVNDCVQFIVKVILVCVFRKINDEVFKVTNSLGYTIVNWNVDTKDWQTAYDSNLIINSLSQSETDNSSKIVLMHDRPFTATVLEAVIKIYLKRGYTFVNMEKCLGIDGYF